ncbi:hypothetical protein IV203_014036 [Nitzschia inconspicua]|uniref:Uncharacterized protein n=1 Tax=Nitzschia inconspicua TaxID=303405 RepID=A0A9K3M9I6_9STRA|nr:hypothetical protein IV203_014036 [Nitzschia inconspicua]
MHFAWATSLLGGSLLSLPNEVHAFREESREWEMLEVDKNLKNKVKDVPLRKRMLHANRRIDRNSNLLHRAQTMEKKECDPSLDDADVGILSCGYNQYCVQSDDSKIGGRCVPTIVTLNHLRHVEETNEDYDTNTPTCNQIPNISFGYLHSYCDEPNCTCTNVNEEEQTLHVACVMDYCYETVSRCGVNFTDCFNYIAELETVTVNPHSYTYSVNVCFDKVGRGNTSICFNHTSVNFTKVGCAVSLNGEACTSCDVVPTFYEVLPYNESISCYNVTASCYHYDCTNVKGGWKGNDCAPEFFQDYGCVECSLCDPGEVVSIPDATLIAFSRSDQSGENVTHCGDGPIFNDVTLAECLELQLNAEDVCGCVPKSDDDAGVPNAPTQSPGDTIYPPTEKPSGTVALTEKPIEEDMCDKTQPSTPLRVMREGFPVSFETGVA